MNVKIEKEWNSKLQEEFSKEYFLNLAEFVREEYRTKTIYPPGGLIFNAFNLCPFQNVKAVIIGQDPYHGPGQAHGLCFSVKEDIDFPPSLINIFKEIESDLGIQRPVNGNLDRWASQGVLLLNATLTVRAHQAGSHQKKGWEQFTDSVIARLKDEFSVFPVGCLCTEKRRINRQIKTPRAGICSPLSSFSLERLLRE